MAALSPGTRLGPYEVVAPLGAGGMGEVYRAKDTRLGREVAIKVLPQHLSAHAEVRARFEREAKTVSSLNHPNICTLFDVGRAPGVAGSGDIDFLVMELVEGETLAQRLTRGALPVAEVLRLGAQIADALDRAHRAGVIHRDLKPGNVMLTKSGAKLMDFGLARASVATGPTSGSGSVMATLTHSPTMVSPLTAEGAIVGTFQYMAPEQLEGREADARADLWALGCVLYEMATGRRAFDGATQASLISSIMRDTPRAMSELVPMSPTSLQRLVTALLAKDPDDRIQTAHDVKLQLQWADEPPSATGAAQTGAAGAPANRARGRGSPIPWLIAAAGLALAAVASLGVFPRGPGVGVRARLMVPEPPNTRLSGLIQSIAISPDGRSLVFVAADSSGTGRLWLRPMNALSASPIGGTENADLPFWSPNSRSIAFFADGKLKRVDLGSGLPEVLGEAPDPRGGAWGSSGIIVFAPSATGGLFSVPEGGGPVTEVARPDSASGEVALRFPEFLPDGRQFLFVSLPRREGGYGVHLAKLGSQTRKFVMRAAASPVYAEPGWLITFARDRLVAQRFDPRQGKLAGKPVTLVESPSAVGHSGTRAASVSRTGAIVYAAARRTNTRFAWLDRTGRVEELLDIPAGPWDQISLSPDNRRALVMRGASSNEMDYWLVDLASGQASRFTQSSSPDYGVPVWSPQGDRVIYSFGPNGPNDLYEQPVDGGAPEVLHRSPVLFKNPYGWSPDGKHATFEQPVPGTGWDVFMISMEGDRTPVPLVQGPANEGGGWFSPDGRWLVYYSDESGSYELYARPFPGPGARRAIAGTRSGSSAFVRGCWWSRDGRELLQLSADGQLKSVAVTPGETWNAGRARDLFRVADDVVSLQPTSDMRRFLATIQVEKTPPPAIVVDLNWMSEVEKR